MAIAKKSPSKPTRATKSMSERRRERRKASVARKTKNNTADEPTFVTKALTSAVKGITTATIGSFLPVLNYSVSKFMAPFAKTQTKMITASAPAPPAPPAASPAPVDTPVAPSREDYEALQQRLARMEEQLSRFVCNSCGDQPSISCPSPICSATARAAQGKAAPTSSSAPPSLIGEKYLKMLKMGLPAGPVRHKMSVDGCSAEEISALEKHCGLEASSRPAAPAAAAAASVPPRPSLPTGQALKGVTLRSASRPRQLPPKPPLSAGGGGGHAAGTPIGMRTRSRVTGVPSLDEITSMSSRLKKRERSPGGTPMKTVHPSSRTPVGRSALSPAVGRIEFGADAKSGGEGGGRRRGGGGPPALADITNVLKGLKPTSGMRSPGGTPRKSRPQSQLGVRPKLRPAGNPNSAAAALLNEESTREFFEKALTTKFEKTRPQCDDVCSTPGDAWM